MSKANPRKAVAAMLPLPLECGGGVEVRPMTLGMWASLERIGSPMVTGKEAKDALELIPSLYLVTHDPREVLRGDFFDAAMAWADTVPATIIEEIHRACARQMNTVFDVVPELKKKTPGETTGSSPRSHTGPRPNSDGAGAKSSGKPRCPQSPSCAASRR